MNITNILKLILVALALSGLCYFGLMNIQADYLPRLGIGLSYLVALAIFGLAALDNRGARLRQY